MRLFYKLLIVVCSLGAPCAQAQQTDTASSAATSASSVTSGTTVNACHGQVFNPVSDPDWNNIFPITIMGASGGPNADPPLMYYAPWCVCPGIFGIPSPGVTVTYWQPMYIAEIQKIAGCASSLGGTQLLSGYDGLNSEQGFFGSAKEATQSTRMQLHWYEYPIFSLLDMLRGLACRSGDGFNLAYMSEVDPTWQDDVWAGIYNPEAGLFANLIAQTACIVDSVAADIDFPLDPLFWCSGTWGGVYPMAGTANQAIDTFQLNNLVMAKFLARQARLGLAWQTIGPDTICGAHVNPIWVKSQYRVNQVYPIARHGAPLVIGAQPIKQLPPMVTNTPGLDDTVNLIWEGQECCIRTY
jgi:conjugal transfer pilus assembly protein TraU